MCFMHDKAIKEWIHDVGKKANGGFIHLNINCINHVLK